jgi:tetratricopeptide (TPR) repeat protein
MVSQVGLGVTHCQQGNYDAALALLPDGVVQAREIGAPYYEALGLAYLVRLHSYLGDWPGAAHWSARLTPMLAREGLPPECYGEGLSALALNAHLTGAVEPALQQGEAAYRHLAPGTIASRKAGICLILGHVRAAAGEPELAAAAYTQAVVHCTKIGNRVLTVEAEAGLAALAQQAGDQRQARQRVEAILPLLTAQPRAGWTTPFFSYLTCYQVLAANQDKRANTVLAQGGRLLQEYAAGIAEPGLRQRFLEGVPAHRALMGLYGAER